MTTVQGIDKIQDSLGYLVLNDDGAVLGVRTNLICINQSPIYDELIWWSQGVLVWQLSLHYKLCMRLKNKYTHVKEENYKLKSVGLDCIKSHELTCYSNIF